MNFLVPTRTPRQALVIKAGVSLTVETVGELLGPAFADAPGPPPTAVVLDLRNVRFVKPFALVSLGAMIERAHERGLPVRVLCPVAPEALLYLAVSGFFLQARSRSELVGAGPYESRHPSTSASTVVPLTRLTNSDEADSVVGGVRDRMRRLAVGCDWFKRFRNLVIETCENVFEHADVDVGYVAAQRYNGAYGPYIELSIGDAGRGVIDSLVEVHPDLDLLAREDALAYAVENGVSSKLEGGGAGLPGLLKVSRDRTGRFLLRSRGARVSADRGATSVRAVREGYSLPGTQVLVTVDC